MDWRENLNLKPRTTFRSGAKVPGAAVHVRNEGKGFVASNWVDAVLNPQTVRDPTTGQLSKVSSMNDHVWINQAAKTSFETRDPNADPNGHLQGTWTLQQRVNGDGSTR